MGFMETVFGGGDQESETTVQLYGPAKEPMDQVLGGFYDAYETAQSYLEGGLPEDFVADMSDAQRSAYNRLQDSRYLKESTEAATGMIGQGQDTLQSGIDPLTGIASGQNQIGFAEDIFNQLYNEDLVQSRIDEVGSDITRNFNENTMPTIDRGAQARGMAGSSRAGIAEGVARRGATEALTGAAQSIRENAWNTANQQSLAISQARQQAQQQAANTLTGAGTNLAQYGIGTAATLGQQGMENELQAVTADQIQRQQEIQGILNRQQLGATLPMLPAQTALGILNPVATGGASTTTTTEGPNPGIMGGISQMAGMASGMMNRQPSGGG